MSGSTVLAVSLQIINSLFFVEDGLNSGCVVSFQETISHLIQLQTATKKRIAEIKECETRIEKAFGYLTKVL